MYRNNLAHYHHQVNMFMRINQNQNPFVQNNVQPNNRSNPIEDKRTYAPINEDNSLEVDPSLIMEEYKELAEEMVCSICINLALEPRECGKCNQVFCSKCLEKWFKTSSNRSNFTVNSFVNNNEKCPTGCRPFVNSSNIKLRNVVDKIKIKCPNHDQGCTNVGKIIEVSVHIQNCDFIGYKCLGQNCSYKSNKKSIEEHIKTCPKLPETCKLCTFHVIRSQIEIHYMECPLRKMKCDYCLKEMTLKDFQNNHLREECALGIISNYEKILEDKKIIKKFFKNVYTSQLLELHPETLVNITNQFVFNQNYFQFFYKEKVNSGEISKDIITIVELIEEVEFNSIEIKIRDYNSPDNKMQGLSLKVFSSITGNEWNQVGEKSFDFFMNNLPLAFPIKCSKSKGKFILITSLRPFRLLKFKFIA